MAPSTGRSAWASFPGLYELRRRYCIDRLYIYTTLDIIADRIFGLPYVSFYDPLYDD